MYAIDELDIDIKIIRNEFLCFLIISRYPV